MASIAQIKRLRLLQAKKVKAVLRLADTALEKLERKITTYTRKKKMIEAGDIPILSTLYRELTQKITSVENEIVSLGRLTGN